MEFNNFAYLIILLGCLAVPLIYSFEKQVAFYKKFRYLFPGMLFTAAIFIIWDLRFEELGIWSFNDKYVTGLQILNLPFEEWLFFLIIPFCCVFIYEILKIKFPKYEYPNVFLVLSLLMLLFFIAIAYFQRDKLYTFFTFFLLSIYLGYTIFRNRFKKHYTKFYLTYFISLLPFMVINILLTSLPVVEYNDTYNLGIRVFTIPVEDFGYLFLLLLMNITIYEYLKNQFSHN
ncbi:MAG: lycopene cyclase domain-containing protein [Bacteroidales bacterium]|jgi:lycopene cyclase domain-containing protein|nr:lycopene cyclase domain-containing protein [Bacteroidales bacterium]